MNGNVGQLSIGYALEDCEIGVPKDITLRVVPTANDAKTGFTGDITEVVDYEHPEAEPPAEKPAPKNAKGMAPAVAIVIAGKSKK